MSQTDTDKIEFSRGTIWLGAAVAWVLIIGIMAAVFGPGDVIHGSKAYNWHPQKCVVVSSSLARKPDGQGELSVVIRYEYEGKSYETTRTLRDTAEHLRNRADVFLKPGEQVSVRVDPANPAQAMLDSEYVIFEFSMVLGVSMTVVCLLIPAVWTMWRANKDRPLLEKAGGAVGRVGMALACVLVLVFCGTATVKGFIGAARMAGTFRWEKASATVEECSVTKERKGELWDYKVTLAYRYQFGGASYRGTRWALSEDGVEDGSRMRKAVAAMKAGDVVTCYVDPKKPDEAILSRCASSYLGLVALPFILLLAGWELWEAATKQGPETTVLEAVLPEELAALAARAQIPAHLQYELTRRQRFVPHMKLWTPQWMLIMIALAITPYGVIRSWWFAGVPVVTVWYWHGFFVGLADVLLHARRRMDVMIELEELEATTGGRTLGAGHQEMLSIQKLTPDVWTIQYAGGLVVNIPVAMITDEQVEYLRLAAVGVVEDEGE